MVVDPRRHADPSFGVLSRRTLRLSPRARRGVLIQLADGTTVAVPRDHLELVLPEHPLAPVEDPSAADWFLRQLEDWTALSVGSLVPRSFPTVCAVLHPWSEIVQGGLRPVTWAEVSERTGGMTFDELSAGEGSQGVPEAELLGHPRAGELDEYTARAVIDVLGTATQTPTDVYFGVWEGRGDLPLRRFPGAALIKTPQRGHVLLHGSLEGALTPADLSGHGGPVSGLWWPADRAWFLLTEVDLWWTFVAGTEQLVERLERHPHLEVLRTTFDSPANRVTGN